MRRREFWLAAVAGRKAAAQGGPRKIAVLGPAEEPRFTQVTDGLRRRLGDLGHPVATGEERLRNVKIDRVRARDK